MGNACATCLFCKKGSAIPHDTLVESRDSPVRVRVETGVSNGTIDRSSGNTRRQPAGLFGRIRADNAPAGQRPFSPLPAPTSNPSTPANGQPVTDPPQVSPRTHRLQREAALNARSQPADSGYHEDQHSLIPRHPAKYSASTSHGLHNVPSQTISFAPPRQPSALGGKGVIFEISDFYPPFKKQYSLVQDRSHTTGVVKQLAAMMKSSGISSLDVQQNPTTDEVRDMVKRYAADDKLIEYSCFICVVLTRGDRIASALIPDSSESLPFYDGFLKRDEIVDPIRTSKFITAMPALFVFEGASAEWLSSPINLHNFTFIWPNRN